MSLSATVVLEIFSGRPDPTWALDDATVAAFRRRLHSLEPSSERRLPADPGLGYRGLHVTIDDHEAGGDVTELRLGRVAHRGRIFVDPGRALERWLLDTAPAKLQTIVQEAKKTF